MATRVDDLQENALTTFMANIAADLEEQKARQLIGGDNLLIYELKSSLAYDLSATVPSFGSFTYYFYYTAQHQDFFFYHTALQIWQDSIADSNLLGPLDYRIDANTFDGIPKQVRFPIIVFNNTLASHTYYIKLYIKCSDIIGVGFGPS